MTTFDFAGSTVLDRLPIDPVPTRRGISLVQLHDELWRVTRVDGEVLGYVESFLEPRGRRYRSKRLIALQKRFLPIGEFWSFDDAVDCLRFG
ncbi:hypothetical protein GCM10022239_15960 [Leifsonia bigeumensis]|uniref:Uncharacterized protein n=1 Tax=Leifsonella bigeumensis TaxID=433643 RepID=A0ABP7FLH1_9MICO